MIAKWYLALWVTVICIAGFGSAQANSVLIAERGDHAPGTPSGVSFYEFSTPVLNVAGEVAFVSTLVGSGVTGANHRGIWAGPPGNVQLVARTGNHAPGTPADVIFESLDDFPKLNAAGEVAFGGRITGSGVTSNNNEGIWVGQPGHLRLVARTGSHAPGTSTGVTFQGMGLSSLNVAGDVLFGGTLKGSGVTSANNAGIWIGQPGNVQLLARKGEHAEGIPTHQGVTFQNFWWPPVLNAAGEVAFLAAIAGSQRINDKGIFVGRRDPGRLRLAARIGDRGPLNMEYTDLGRPVLNALGEIAFYGRIGGYEATDAGIFRGHVGSIRFVAREGSRAPDTENNVNFDSFGRDPQIAPMSSKVLFQADLRNGGVNSNNDEGLWLGNELVARKGERLPGTPPEMNPGFDPSCGWLEDPIQNLAGEVAFVGGLASSGADGNIDGMPYADHRGIWRGHPGNLSLVARKGSPLTLSSGDTRTLFYISCTVALSDSGQLAFKASFTNGAYGIVLTPYQAPIAGKIAINHTWQNVSLPIDFSKPVVIVGPPTFHGNQPGVVRIRKLTSTNFELRFQEWNYLDGIHVAENLPYLVLETGRHLMPDGSTWEVGTFDLAGTDKWKQIDFNSVFTGLPAVFLTIQSYNESDPVTVRARNVGVDHFEAALFEEEARMNSHASEKVGYVAIDCALGNGSITVGGIKTPYLLQFPTVDHRFVPVLSTAVKLEEEQSLDSEIEHKNETVATLSLGQKLFSQIVSYKDGDTVALRQSPQEDHTLVEWGTVHLLNHNWKTIPLGKQFVNPVVIAGPVSEQGGDPTTIRLRNVYGNSFDMRLQEWLYLDGWHAKERAFYLVAEAGILDFAGLRLQAGKITTNSLLGEAWKIVFFPTRFDSVPAVFHSIMTANGGDTVITRARFPFDNRFIITMDEEEGRRDGHVDETLGWIAIERGGGSTVDNRSIEVKTINVTDQSTAVPLGTSGDHRFPVILCSPISVSENDPIFLRYRNLTPESVELFLHEEQSQDSETVHVSEEVSLFVAE